MDRKVIKLVETKIEKQKFLHKNPILLYNM